MEAPQTNGKKKIIILLLKCYKKQNHVKRSLQKLKKMHFSYSRLCLFHKNILSLHQISKTATKLQQIFYKNKLKFIYYGNLHYQMQSLWRKKFILCTLKKSC